MAARSRPKKPRAQTALDAIEAAKDALRDAPTGAGSGAKRVSGKAAAAEAQALARASRLAAGLALVGPSFAESKNEHAFRLCRDALVEALAGLARPAELSPTNLAAAAAGAAAASSLRALAGGGGAAEDALGAWTAATDGVRTRADAEASAAPNARRARARGGGSNGAEWDGTVPEGTIVETV